MKWSTPVVVASIGPGVTAVHVVPLLDVEKTMSLAGQPDRNRQSCQATYTVPAASISADGRPPPSRTPPATGWADTLPIRTVELQDVPPLVEVNERIADPLAEYGTTTVPLGCTTGCPPRPDGLPDGEIDGDQVAPPSLERLMTIRLPLVVTSTSM